MTKLSPLLILMFSLPVYADPSLQFARQAEAGCRKVSFQAVESFKSEKGFSFEQGIVSAYGTKRFNAIYDTNLGFDKSFCNSFIGEKWGRIKFSTNVKKLEVYVNDTPKNASPNAENPMLVGLYSIKLKSGKKQCYGDAEVTENKLKVFHCDF